MPMSERFQERLFPILPEIIKYFGTPFHIFDEQGIIDTGEYLKSQFHDVIEKLKKESNDATDP